VAKAPYYKQITSSLLKQTAMNKEQKTSIAVSFN